MKALIGRRNETKKAAVPVGGKQRVWTQVGRVRNSRSIAAGRRSQWVETGARAEGRGGRGTQ